MLARKAIAAARRAGERLALGRYAGEGALDAREALIAVDELRDDPIGRSGCCKRASPRPSPRCRRRTWGVGGHRIGGACAPTMADEPCEPL